MSGVTDAVDARNSRVVFRGGWLADGSGEPGRVADVAIYGDRIVGIGAIEREPGDQEIDVVGLVVSPGFIDCHTHYDAQITWDPSLTPSPWHGVTSVVMGNCGFSIAPIRPDDRSLICNTLEVVEGMSADVLEEGIDWQFETFPQWLDYLDRTPKRINVASMIGHTALRLYQLGPEAWSRKASEQQLVDMVALVREAIECGAVGFATSLSPNHQGHLGNPVPSRGADMNEISELASTLGSLGRGIVQVTPGPGLFLHEIASLAEDVGRPVTWTGLLTRGGVPWPGWSEEADHPLPLLRKQRQLSSNVWPQISCRDLVMQVSLSDPMPFSSLPAFKEILAQPRSQRAALYSDDVWREKARQEMDAFWGHRWSKTSIQETEARPELADGRGLDDIGSTLSRHPFDVMVDVALADQLKTRFRVVIANDDEDELAALLTEHETLIALSDAGAHASQLSDACYSTHLLGHWVRERKVLGIEEAVWRLTGQGADLFGIQQRGRIAVGNFADVCVFDPDTVGPGELERVHDLPAGGDRLISRPVGVHSVWVNGSLVVANNEEVPLAPEDHPGVLLRHGG